MIQRVAFEEDAPDAVAQRAVHEGGVVVGVEERDDALRALDVDGFFQFREGQPGAHVEVVDEREVGGVLLAQGCP